MNLLSKLKRKNTDGILVSGIHEPVIQSILDFDYLSGKSAPSIRGIITNTRTAYKLFFGTGEVIIPCFKALDEVPNELLKKSFWFLSLESGRRAAQSVAQFFSFVPWAYGAHIFAENVPELHATELIKRFGKKYSIFGPSGVGFLIPGVLKLGAIGGVGSEQILRAQLTQRGSIAVCSTSGGMVNELINAVVDSGRRISFAACVGGDRFPVTSLTDVFMAAEADKNTKAVVYFGELGGSDEYEIIELIKTKRFTKPLVAYIAGTIDDAFDERMQFGHAKALVRVKDESAVAKREALSSVGVKAPQTFFDFLREIGSLPQSSSGVTVKATGMKIERQKSILTTRKILPLEHSSKNTVRATAHNIAGNFIPLMLEALLGQKPRSRESIQFADLVFSLLIDHGGHVSGAVNTMITARAGRDMATSLSAGLLTIGSRFGGSVNAAAEAWLSGVMKHQTADALIDEWGKKKQPIPGIGHKKYRIGVPDPRVKALLALGSKLKNRRFSKFALAVEKITTRKNGKLILNIDGAIAAVFLDILSEREGLSEKELHKLTQSEFFNAFFILPRSVGFVAHFLEQKKNDEGLFRLPDELLLEVDSSSTAKKNT